MSRFAYLSSSQDPRQYVPPGGQVWTSLAKLKGRHENHFEQDPTDKRIWFITTEPKVSCHCIALIYTWLMLPTRVFSVVLARGQYCLRRQTEMFSGISL